MHSTQKIKLSLPLVTQLSVTYLKVTFQSVPTSNKVNAAQKNNVIS